MKKILIVEDEEILRDALSQRISDTKKFQVSVARNGREGLNLALSDLPDIILADIKMPEMDGLTMMKELHKNEKTKDMQIIFLTNYDTNEDMLRSITETKTCYYLIKSNTSITDIIDKISSCLGD